MEHIYRNALASLIKAVRADSEGLNDELEQAEILLEQDEQPTGQLKLTPGTWDVHSTGLLPHKFEIHLPTDIDGENPIADIHGTEEQAEANARAIVTAVNNTFGKGLRPEKYIGVIEALTGMLKWASLTAKPLLGEDKLPKGFEKWQAALIDALLDPKTAKAAIQSATIK